jgi:hypothetical protein
MAVSVTAINAITKQNFIPKLVDNVMQSNALLMFMEKNKGLENLDGGQDIRVPVRYARFSSRGWYAGGEVQSTAYNEKKTALVFDWKQYYVNITISGIDKLKNAGENKVIDHVRSEVESAEEDLKDAFGTGLYSNGTTDPKSIVGVRGFLSTSATYGGISQSSESWLAAQIDSTTTSLSLVKMQERYEACKINGEQPNLITTTETLFNSFWGLLQPQQRFQDSDTASAGFKNLLFNGAVVMQDDYAPASHMIFLNTKFIKLYSHKDRKFPGEYMDFRPFFDQDAEIAKMQWAGALVCSSPRLQGAMTALTS